MWEATPEDLSAARYSRERLGSDENSAILIERAFSIVSVTRHLLDQFAIGLENNAIRSRGVYTVGMISKCLMAHPARHRAAVLVCHQESNAVLFQILLFEAR